eukprot:1390943-Rhodomonas_salina.1
MAALALAGGGALAEGGAGRATRGGRKRERERAERTTRREEALMRLAHAQGEATSPSGPASTLHTRPRCQPPERT